MVSYILSQKYQLQDNEVLLYTLPCTFLLFNKILAYFCNSASLYM